MMLAITDVLGTACIGAIVTVALALINRKLNGTAKIIDTIHTLTNSNMGSQLKLNAELSRWKADQTQTKKDFDAAVVAEKLYVEHQVKQDAVDAAQKKTNEIAKA